MHTRELAVPQLCRLSAWYQAFRSQTFARSLQNTTLAFAIHSGSDLIINIHCSGDSASQVGEFINNFQFLSIHSDGRFMVRFSRCWLVYNLSFCADCEIIVIT